MASNKPTIHPEWLGNYTTNPDITSKILQDLVKKVDLQYKLEPHIAEIFSWIYKGVESVDAREFFAEFPSILPMYAGGVLEPGHHWAPKRHFNPTVFQYRWYNRHSSRISWSILRVETHQYKDAQQLAKHLDSRRDAAAKGAAFWWYVIINLMFLCPTEMAKLNSAGLKIDEKTKELDVLTVLLTFYNKAKGDCGYEFYNQDKSLEQLIGYFKDNKFEQWDCCKLEGGKCTAVCDNAAQLEKHHIDTHALFQTLCKIRCVLRNNCFEADSKDEAKKIYKHLKDVETGTDTFMMFRKAKKLITEMKNSMTGKFNVGVCQNCTGDNICDKACGANEGACEEACKQTCGSEKKCCNTCEQLAHSVSGSDLALLVNINDVLEYEDVLANFDTGGGGLALTPANMGVSKIIPVLSVRQGECCVIHKHTLNLFFHGHPITGSDTYREVSGGPLVNHWLEWDFNIGIWPYPCFWVKKKTS